jgi:hypothetical protein
MAFYLFILFISVLVFVEVDSNSTDRVPIINITFSIKKKKHVHRRI